MTLYSNFWFLLDFELLGGHNPEERDTNKINLHYPYFILILSRIHDEKKKKKTTNLFRQIAIY